MENQLKIRIPQVIVDLDAPLENNNQDETETDTTPPSPPPSAFRDMFLKSIYNSIYTDYTNSTTPPPPSSISSSSVTNNKAVILDVNSMKYYHTVEKSVIKNKSILYYFGNACILIICIPVCIVLLPFLILSYIGA
jgi:hypothetical protein